MHRDAGIKLNSVPETSQSPLKKNSDLGRDASCAIYCEPDYVRFASNLDGGISARRKR